MSIKRRVKAGTSRDAAAARKEKFVDTYLANGRNATQAAITAGYSAKSARAQGCRLLTDANIAKKIAEHTEKAAQISGLELERTLREVARVAYSDPRRLFEANGKLIGVTALPEDVAATVASIETDEKGIKKIKLWDKNAALEKAMKYHGLYEKDNRQRGESVALTVLFGTE